MSVEKMRKLAFAGNIGAIGFISGLGFASALTGHLNLATGIIYAILIILNAWSAKGQW